MGIEKGPRAKSSAEEISSDIQELIEFLGESEGDEVVSAVQQLQDEISNVPRVGRSSESRVPEFVIPLVSQEQKERILDALFSLGIFPWEEEGLLIIEREKDLKKLQLAGLYAPKETVGPAETAGEEAVTDVLSERKEYTFPFKPADRAFPSPEQKGQPKPTKHHEEEDVLEADAELAQLIQDFDAGIVDYEDPVFRRRFGDVPTLSLFPHKYQWENGVAYNRHTGEAIAKTEQKEMIQAAQAGDQHAMEELVRMHVGLVLRQIPSIKDKLGYSLDSDDLFQEGLLGLMRAIQKHDTEKASLTTYAVVRIDSRMRRFAFEHLEQVRRPSHVSQKRAPYYRAREAVRDAGVSPENEEAAIEERLRGEGILSAGKRYDDFKRRYLIGVLFDPVDESFNEDEHAKELYDVTAMGEDMYEDPFRAIDQQIDMSQVYAVLSTLPPREEFALRAHFGLVDSPMVLSGLGERGEQQDDRVRAVKLLLPNVLERIQQLKQGGIDPHAVQSMNTTDRFLLAVSGNLPRELQSQYAIEPELSLAEVGELLGVSRSRANQITAKAIRKMKPASIRGGQLRPPER